MKKSFTVLVLAGGLGSRLRPVVSGLPKVLAKVNRRFFLSYLLDQLIEAGVRDVILCTGYLGQLIRDKFGSYYKGLTIRYSQELLALGTGGALRYAMALVESESVLVMNGDSYCRINLKEYIGWHFKKKYNSSLVLARVEDKSRYGSVKIDSKGRVLNFEEKKPKSESNWVNGGIYIFKSSILAAMPSGVKLSLEKEWLPVLVKDRILYGFCFDGKFIDIGTPESFLSAKDFLK